MENKKSLIRSLFGRKPARQAAPPPEAAPAHARNEFVSPSSKLAPAAQPAEPHGPPGAQLLEEHRPTIWKVGDLIDQTSEVREILGGGGMGTVYKVYYRPQKREMAVKCPRPEIFARAEGKAHFIQEAETWTALGAYPHIVTGYFVLVINSIPHVFAEYVPGGSLAEWIAQRRLYAGGPEQALSRILDIAIQFAWGLHFAHERGLVHQDVKPANVMVTEEGIAKVTDFGLARARLLAGESAIAVGDGQQSMLVSSRGMTPAYCSPEQAAGHPLSRTSDIWSWGVSVLEMFVGEVTWRMGVVAGEALASYKAEDPARPVMPEAVISLLRHCFQQEPGARPATMLAVATELEKIYASCVGRQYPRAIPRSSPETLVDTFGKRASSLGELGRPGEALATIEQLLGLDPNNAAAHVIRGMALHRLGRPGEALTAFDQALRLDPNNALAHNNRGDVLRDLGRPGEALAALDQALRLEPDDVATHNNRGNVLNQLGRREEALATLEHALRLDPNNAVTHNNRGSVLRDLGRREEALAAFDQALRLDPNNAGVHENRLNVLREIGRTKGVLAAYEQVLQLDPNDAPGYRNLGLALSQLGRREEALAAFEHVLHLDPSDAFAHNDRGLTLLQLGRREEALAALEHAVRLDPNNANAHLNLGMAHGQQGRRKEALAALELSLRLNPNNALAYRSLAVVLRELGRPEEAARALQKARALQSQR